MSQERIGQTPEWFVTWDRPEYQEWAREITGGYSLVVVRKEPDSYLCVKAELIMGARGLPDFKVIEEHNFPTQQEAETQVQDWKK